MTSNPVSKSQRHTLAVGITNRCPLRCSFCCVPPGPGDLDVEILDRLIEEVVADPSKWKGVGFTGGEPLVRTDVVCSLGNRLQSAGVPWGLTTGLGWASNDIRAISTATKLVSAGISRLNVSFDPSHHKELRRSHHSLFLDYMLQHGISTVVSCTLYTDEEMTDDEVFSGLGICNKANVDVERHYVAKAGFAENHVNCSTSRFSLASSKCPLQDGLTISVWPDGSVFPCCSTYIVNKENGLSCGNVQNESLSEIVSRIDGDAYFNLIRRQGFSALIGLLGDSISSLPEVFSDPPHDVCHLCVKLDKTEGIENLRQKILRKMHNLVVPAQ